MASWYSRGYGDPKIPSDPADYYSFRVDYGDGNAMERLVHWMPNDVTHYTDCTIEYWRCDEGELPQAYEQLRAMGYGEVEQLAEDPELTSGREPSRRALFATAAGKLFGVIINPPYPLI